jgi:hypothetical protein
MVKNLDCGRNNLECEAENLHGEWDNLECRTDNPDDGRQNPSPVAGISNRRLPTATAFLAIDPGPNIK